VDEFNAELIALLNQLLPGFLTAWIFYGLTAYRRPSQFERIAQALVFTSIIQIFRIGIKNVVSLWAPGEWSTESDFVCSWILAVLLGLFISWCAHQDFFHRWLRALRLTSNTSYPSAWYSAAKRYKTDIILNLKDGHRLQGWPYEWPDHLDEGQFALCDASWLREDGPPIDLSAAECLVIPAVNVEFVEFLKCGTDCSSPESTCTLSLGYTDKDGPNGEAEKESAHEKDGLQPWPHGSSSSKPAARGIDSGASKEKITGGTNAQENRKAKSSNKGRRR
jgi:hypothetical protein